MGPEVRKGITLLKSCPAPFLPLYTFLHRHLFPKPSPPSMHPSCWMEAGVFPSTLLSPWPGQGVLCHLSPAASVRRRLYGQARSSPHFSIPIAVSSLLHVLKHSGCKSLCRGPSSFHSAPSEHQLSGCFFSELPSFAFPVTRAGASHKDNFIPVYYGEGHMHL